MDELIQIQDKILRQYIDDVRKAIIQSQVALGITGSTYSARAMKVQSAPLSGSAFLAAPSYLPTNFNGVGRRPSDKFPPKWAILNWMRTKPGFIPRDKQGRFVSYESAAYLIARKIAQDGTDIYTGKKKGVPIIPILKKLLPPAGRKLAQAYARDYANDVKKLMKK